MRVKEIDKTANVAWSPEKQFPVYIVAGTAAQQLDATFRYIFSIFISIYNLNSYVQCTFKSIFCWSEICKVILQYDWETDFGLSLNTTKGFPRPI